MVIRLFRFEYMRASFANCSLDHRLPVTSSRAALLWSKRFSPRIPIPVKMATRRTNAIPNLTRICGLVRTGHVEAWGGDQTPWVASAPFLFGSSQWLLTTPSWVEHRWHPPRAKKPPCQLGNRIPDAANQERRPYAFARTWLGARWFQA